MHGTSRSAVKENPTAGGNGRSTAGTGWSADVRGGAGAVEILKRNGVVVGSGGFAIVGVLKVFCCSGLAIFGGLELLHVFLCLEKGRMGKSDLLRKEREGEKKESVFGVLRKEEENIALGYGNL